MTSCQNPKIISNNLVFMKKRHMVQEGCRVEEKKNTRARAHTHTHASTHAHTQNSIKDKICLPINFPIRTMMGFWNEFISMMITAYHHQALPIILARTKAGFNTKLCSSQHMIATPPTLGFTSKTLNGTLRSWGQCVQMHWRQWPEGWVFRPVYWGKANDLSEIRTNHLPNARLQRRYYTRPLS